MAPPSTGITSTCSDVAPYCIGLTGGIGCGKTTVSALFAALGASVIDTDEIARGLTHPDGAAIPAIRHAFGSEFITSSGALDRERMRHLVFTDVNSKRILEGILHPLIRREADKLIAAARQRPYVILVVPLLLETGAYRELVRRTLVVDCDERLQITRTQQRSGLSEPEVRAIMATQTGREERLAAADDVITNDGDIPQLEDRVAELHRAYVALAADR